MKKVDLKRLFPLLTCLLLLVLEALPFGAVLTFAKAPESNSITKKCFSYFSLVPFGYANFGPLLTALLSVLLLLILFLNLFFSKRSLLKAAFAVAVPAFLTSLMPLFLGIRFFSVLGGVISLVLLLEILQLFYLIKE